MTLTITGTGAMTEFPYYNSAPWNDLRLSIKSVVVESGVKSIGSNAFRDCANLNNVSIPKTVKSFGEFSFYNCTNLLSIDIPEGVESIQNCAFSYCESLTSLTLRSTLIEVSGIEFTKLAEFKMESSSNPQFECVNGVLFDKVDNIIVRYPPAKSGSYEIPSSVNEIGDYAFSDCRFLTALSIPESVSSIGWKAFAGCTSLTYIEIPSEVVHIDEECFNGCNSLQSINASASNKYFQSINGFFS